MVEDGEGLRRMVRVIQCSPATGRPLPFHRTANPSDCTGLRVWECGPLPMQGDGPVCLIGSLAVTYA